MTAKDITTALINYYDPRKVFIIPNVSWGWNIHECDLFVVNNNRFGYEIEIKISIADLKHDAVKNHQHMDKHNRIKYLWFAVTDEMIDKGCQQYIPEGAGIFSVGYKKVRYNGADGKYFDVKVIRNPTAVPNHRKITDEEMLSLGRLSMIRMCSLIKKDQLNIPSND